MEKEEDDVVDESVARLPRDHAFRSYPGSSQRAVDRNAKVPKRSSLHASSLLFWGSIPTHPAIARCQSTQSQSQDTVGPERLLINGLGNVLDNPHSRCVVDIGRTRKEACRHAIHLRLDSQQTRKSRGSPEVGVLGASNKTRSHMWLS